MRTGRPDLQAGRSKIGTASRAVRPIFNSSKREKWDGAEAVPPKANALLSAGSSEICPYRPCAFHLCPFPHHSSSSSCSYSTKAYLSLGMVGMTAKRPAANPIPLILTMRFEDEHDDEDEDDLVADLGARLVERFRRAVRMLPYSSAVPSRTNAESG